MTLEEGQIYEANVSLMGDDGPHRTWLVIAPFGKLHIHSIDDPVDLHCWPAATLEMGVGSERVRLIGKDPDHPVIRLQRLKEALGIRDADLGLADEKLDKMLQLVDHLFEEGSELAPYAAGEVLELTRRASMPESHVASIARRINDKLNGSRPGG